MASDRRIRDFRCFTFKGRMRRKPFWFWLLPYFLTCCVLGALLALTFIAADSSAALSIFLLIVFFAGLVGTVIACYAIFFQRLHDIGLSGWWAIGMMIFGVICAVVDSVTVSSSISRKPRHRRMKWRSHINRRSISASLLFFQKSFVTQRGTPSR